MSSEETESGGLATLKIFRIVAMIEGVSFIVLLAIAMPMKYLMGEPGLVRVVGMAHGVLFLLYVWMLMQCTLVLRWRLTQSLTYFVASMIPLAAIWVDRQLVAQQRGLSETTK